MNTYKNELYGNTHYWRLNRYRLSNVFTNFQWVILYFSGCGPRPNLVYRRLLRWYERVGTVFRRKFGLERYWSGGLGGPLRFRRLLLSHPIRPPDTAVIRRKYQSDQNKSEKYHMDSAKRNKNADYFALDSATTRVLRQNGQIISAIRF